MNIIRRYQHSRFLLQCFLLLAVVPLVANASQNAFAAEPAKTEWGQIAQEAGDVGKYRLTVTSPPQDGKLLLPVPFANITRAYSAEDRERQPLIVEFNDDATQIALHLDSGDMDAKAREIVLETAEKSAQFPDGRIVLSALDAKVIGSRAKLETHPGNHRIGFWNDASDSVSWNYNATRPGTYDVELTYSGDANDGTEIEVAIGDVKLTGKLKATGSWYRYTTVPLGKLQLPKPQGEYPVTVRCTKKTGGAVMNLKAITLRPSSEGKLPAQEKDSSVVLDARDATICGVTLRWEPQPNKNTVGYWANPSDHVVWDFEVSKPGRFDVEVLQGCGKGQGGSEVEVSVGGEQLKFTVQDTGHFQNFVERTIGQVNIDKPGWHKLTVRPLKKAGAAVMDLRRVRLMPVKK